ncbi:MAG TPA: transglycosylase [Roseomonas sp.]|jgi:hypothetical protein
MTIRFGGLARGLHDRLHGVALLLGTGLLAMGLTAGGAHAAGNTARRPATTHHHVVRHDAVRHASAPAAATATVASPAILAAVATPPWAAVPNLPALSDAAVAPSGSPRAACLDALRASEQRYNLPPGLLVAIGLNESGLHAHALNISGRASFPESRAEAERMLRGASNRGYVMAGCLQINARVHARGEVWPLDPQAAGDWGARFLRTNYDRTGDWAEVLRRWHGASPRAMATYVCRVRGKIEAVEPNSPIFADRQCGTSQLARLRRNGAAHLELAEAR